MATFSRQGAHWCPTHWDANALSQTHIGNHLQEECFCPVLHHAEAAIRNCLLSDVVVKLTLSTFAGLLVARCWRTHGPLLCVQIARPYAYLWKQDAVQAQSELRMDNITLCRTSQGAAKWCISSAARDRPGVHKCICSLWCTSMYLAPIWAAWLAFSALSPCIKFDTC